METTAAPALYLGGRVAWDAGFLVVTDPELLAKVDRPYLSASTSKAVHSCPARMVSDKAVPSGFDLFGATEKGSAAHTVLERMYALAPGRRDEQHAMAILTEMSREAPQGDDDVDYARAIGQDPVRYNQWIAAIYASYKGLFAIEDPKTVEVHSTEMRFDGVEVAGVPFKGFIDRLDVLDDGLKVVDYKTGKDVSKPNPRFDDDHGNQIRLYVEAVRAKTGEKPRAGYLLYITHGKQRRVAISDTEINKTKRGFAASWVALRTAVETQRFEAKTSALCGWCSLVNSCPVGIAAGKVDRKGGAPSAIDLGIPSLRPDGTFIPLVGHTSRWGEAGVPPLPGAAHLLGEEEISRADEGNNIMATSDRKWKEAKPYEGSDIDGHLSLNSYAATAVFGMTSLAAELLVKGGQKVGPAPVKALAALLATVVMDAQAAVTNGSRDWQEGANTRLRGVLRTSLDVIPLPFGQDEAAWTKWVARTHTFITTVAATAIDLYDNGPVVDLGALASATVLVAVPAAA